VTPADVEALVRDDVRAISDARVVAHVCSLMAVPPQRLPLAWSFGSLGETLDGFLVLDHPRSGTGIVYCGQGFGPDTPWGLVFIDRGPLSTGTSDGWYARVLDAYFASKAPADLAIWRVREWRPTRAGAWVSGDLPWDEAWARVSALRASEPHTQYYCDHSVMY
jgi:hypothetical protein